MVKPSQKLCVIVNQVAFFATAKQVRSGVGILSTLNKAVAIALIELENLPGSVGVVTQACGYQVQIDFVR